MTSHASYDNYPDKDKLREVLLSEQGGLCCYCMGRIPDKQGKVKIEHWQSVANYPQNQLIYQNLLATCKGGEGEKYSNQYCDTRKGGKDLLFNPANPAHHAKLGISYGTDGTIQSRNPDFDRQLNDTLNLNYSSIKNHRKGVYDSLVMLLKLHTISRKRLEKQISMLSYPSEQLEPYVGVAIWWLEKKLAKISD